MSKTTSQTVDRGVNRRLSTYPQPIVESRRSTPLDMLPDDLSNDRMYRVTIKGIEVKADTVDEVLALVQRILTTDGAEVRVAAPPPEAWTADLIDQFVKVIRPHAQQRTTISHLSRAGEAGLLKEELVEILKLDDARQLGGVLSGISKSAKRAECPSVFRMEEIQDDNGWTSRYILEPSFLAAMAEWLERRKQQQGEQAAV